MTRRDSGRDSGRLDQTPRLPNTRRSMLWLCVNSSLAAGLGVFWAVVASNIGQALAALLDGREATLFHNRVDVTLPLPAYSELGALAGPLVVGLFILAVYSAGQPHSPSKLAALWGIIQCAQLSAVSLATSGLITTSGWIRWLPGVGAVIVVVLLGLAGAPAFLTFAPHHRRIDTRQRRVSFMVFAATIPALVGSAVGLLYLRGSDLPEVAGLPVMWMAPAAVVLLLGAAGTTSVRGPEYQVDRRFSFGLLALVAAVVALSVFLLADGVTVRS
jgi:hypothetical protein